jgi:hypothetical protein
MEDIKTLAGLIHEHNRVTDRISALVGRPAVIGHVGEFIASRIFGIELEHSASTKAIDGHFKHGKLAGKSVNVKWYTKNDGFLDMRKDALPDFYLVLAGPKTAAVSSEGTTRPWVIEYVYLVGAEPLVRELKKRGIEPTEATSVRRADWEMCELYPEPRCPYFTLTDEQKALIGLFRTESIGSSSA